MLTFGSFGLTSNNDLARGAGLTVLIPVAGVGRRIKSLGPKALIELRPGETVLGRQLALVQRVLPLAEVVVVLGHEADRIYRTLPARVRAVESELHETTNVARSLDLGLRATVNQRVLIIYGDLVYNEETLRGLPLRTSCVLVDEGAAQMGEFEVGVTVVDGRVTQFSYGLEQKWAQIAFLTGAELQSFRRLVRDPDRRRYFGFEVLNDLLEKGGQLVAISLPKTAQLAEIDTVADLERATKVQ